MAAQPSRDGAKALQTNHRVMELALKAASASFNIKAATPVRRHRKCRGCPDPRP